MSLAKIVIDEPDVERVYERLIKEFELSKPS
jgi:hypothetical protein